MARKMFGLISGIIIIALCAPMFVLTTPVSVSAAGACDESFFGLPTWHKYLNKNSECEITGPTARGSFDWPKAAGYVGIAVVEILLRLASIIAVGYVMFGGFKFITSQGEPDGAKAARETIINALVGLVITIAAASIISFIGNRLG